MRTLAPVSALAIIISLMLGGCVPSAPDASPTPEPSSTPVFASEEEALAAAEEAYAAYVAMSDLIFVEGGANAERMTAVATGAFLEATLSSFNEVQANGLHSTGGTVFRDVSLQSYSPDSLSADIVSVYVCEDISAVNVFDSAGQSIVSADRPDQTVFQVVFDLGNGGGLLVASREVWKNEPC